MKIAYTYTHLGGGDTHHTQKKKKKKKKPQFGARETISLYVTARALQSCRLLLGQRGYLPRRIPYGDVALFAACTAQILSSYTLAPASLPRAYRGFIRNVCPITEDALDKVGEAVLAGTADIGTGGEDQHKRGDATGDRLGSVVDAAAVDAAAVVPCAVLHPHQPSCVFQAVDAFAMAARRLMPLYLVVHAAPKLVVSRGTVLFKDRFFLLRVAARAARSSSFLGCVGGGGRIYDVSSLFLFFCFFCSSHFLNFFRNAPQLHSSRRTWGSSARPGACSLMKRQPCIRRAGFSRRGPS
jgi:hypothetical protein